jgi:hypothetical protein
MIYRTIACFAGRYSHPVRDRLMQMFVSISGAPTTKLALELTEHTSEAAASSSFFADFWSEARTTAGMAPRRDAADLAWRFWKRPGFMGTTLTYEWPEGGRAYLIVDTSYSLHFSLEDFFITPVNPERFECLLDALFVWCAQHGTLAIRCMTMTQGLPPQLLEVLLRKMKPFLLQRFRPSLELPRRISPLGRAKSKSELSDWNTTKILFVG